MTSKNRKQVTAAWVSIATIIAMVFGALLSWLGGQVAENPGSFMLSWLVLAALGAVFSALAWASSPQCSTLQGAAVSLAIVVITSVILYAWNPFQTLDWGSFGLGVFGLMLALMALGFAWVATNAFHRARRYTVAAVRNSA